MICNRCLRAAARHLDAPRTASTSFLTRFRPLSTTSRLSSTPNAAQSSEAPAATSTSVAQPFSEPMAAPAQKGKKDKTARVQSSIAAGQRLKGLNLLKGKEDPVALPDEEYPPWLWTLLDAKSGSAAVGDGEGDLYAKSAKQRRKAAKALRKREAMLAGKHVEPKVPVEEQSVDLPAGGAGAGAARLEITRALRQKRRAGIKEANFLKGVS